jgi:hypothetical protein
VLGWELRLVERCCSRVATETDLLSSRTESDLLAVIILSSECITQPLLAWLSCGNMMDAANHRCGCLEGMRAGGWDCSGLDSLGIGASIITSRQKTEVSVVSEALMFSSQPPTCSLLLYLLVTGASCRTGNLSLTRSFDDMLLLLSQQDGQ